MRKGLTVNDCAARANLDCPCVYFIDNQLGFIKIGKTKNVWKRIHEAQTYSPLLVQCVATINCSHIRQAEDIERLLHEEFKAYRKCGEWFELEPIREAIKDGSVHTLINKYLEGKYK